MKFTLADLGMEAIDFQRNAKLNTELTIFFTQLKGLDDPARQSEILASISKVIFEETGMSVTVSITDADNYKMSGGPIPLTRNHPFATADFRMKLMRVNMSRQGIQKAVGGDVDDKACRVSGSFSEVPCFVNIPKKFFTSDKFSGEEIAAGSLHELGHCYGYFRFLGQAFRSNLVIRDIALTWAETDDTKVRIKVLDEAENIIGKKFENKAELAKAGEADIPITIVAANAIDDARSELGTKFYDQRAFEAMADQFAARHGAGRALVTLMDKIGRDSNVLTRNGQYDPAITKLVFNVLSLAFSAVTPAKGALLGLKFTTDALIFSQILGGTVNIFLGSLMGDFSYDDPYNRYKSVRQELIASLKDRSTSPEYQRGVLQDIEVVDQAMSALNRFPTITSLINKFIGGTINGSRKEMAFQRQFEELANNELFAKAAQLSQLPGA